MIPVFAYSLAISAALGAAFIFERLTIDHPYSAPIFRHLVLYQDLYALPPYIAILCLALVPAVRKAGVRAADWCGEHPWPTAALTTVALAAGALFVYHAYPLSMDEYTVVFQSEIFAAGHLAGQFPPELLDWLIPKVIQGKFLKPDSQTGAIAAAYWPGFSLLLTPFMLLGVPWLLNPLIGGATVLVLHRIALVLFEDRRAAGLVALLAIASSAITINAMSFYSMPAHLLANAVYVLLLLRPTPTRAALAGLAGSVALVLHSPIPHLFFALTWIVWLAFQPGGRRAVAALFAGYLPLCLLIGFGWAMYLDGLKLINRYGELVAPQGMVQSFLSRVSMILEWLYEPSFALHVMNFGKLWVWAVPGLIVLAALGVWRLRHERGIWLAIAGSALVSYVGYLYIPFDQGHGWGYRYFHQAWLALPLLAVAALQRAPQPALSGYVAGSALLSLAVMTSFQALQVKTFIERHLAQLPAVPPQVRVVIVNPLNGYYAWDLVQNDPFLREPVLKLMSRGAQADRDVMAKVFPKYQLLAADRRAAYWGLR